VSERSFRILAAFERASLAATRALSVVGLAALMVLAFLTLANGLLRWLLNQPIAGVVDLGALAIALAVSCCLPVAQIEHGHIAFRLIGALRPRIGRLLDLLAAIIVAVVLVLMALEFSTYAAGLVQSGETTYVLKLPTAPFWYGVDAILWSTVLVQAIVVAVQIARVAGYRSVLPRDSH
jgi:TRAP-type C4-dicarboxylate transport system permease small subunit